jgi:hypothetical protein
MDSKFDFWRGVFSQIALLFLSVYLAYNGSPVWSCLFLWCSYTSLNRFRRESKEFKY